MNRGAYLFRPKPGERHREHEFYRKLYPSIIRDIQVTFTCHAFSWNRLCACVDFVKYFLVFPLLSIFFFCFFLLFCNHPETDYACIADVSSHPITIVILCAVFVHCIMHYIARRFLTAVNSCALVQGIIAV